MKAVHPIPRPLKDEDKWLGLTKKQMIYCILAVILIVAEFKFFSKFHLYVVGIIVAIIIVIFVIALFVVKKSYESYMYGGGLTAEKYIYRVMFRKLKSNKVIYVKNIHTTTKGDKQLTVKLLNRVNEFIK